MSTPYRVVITADAKPATDALNSIEGAANRAADSLDTATKVGVGFGVVLPQLAAVKNFALNAADGITALTSRLTLVTGSTQAAIGVQSDLYRIAQDSRVNFLELGNTYAVVARSAQALGISQDRVLTVTQSIGQAMALSGGTAAGMQAALVQLSQGLGAGALRGEELNSVMEQTPRLAQAIADGLGVPIGQLKVLGEQGQLTTDKVIMALEKAGPQLATELGKSTMTVGQAMTVLTNSATRLVGDADAATGKTASLAATITSLAKAVDEVGRLIRENQGAFQVLAGAASAAAGLAAVGGAITAIKAAVAALGAVMAANPVVLTLLGLAAAGGAVATIVNQRADETKTLQYKMQELAELQAKLDRFEASGSPGRNTQLRARIQALTDDIKAQQAAAFNQFRAGERDTTPNAGPYPSAKSIDEARKLGKLDLDVKSQYFRDVQTLNESFQQAMFRESDPTKRAALAEELQRRQKVLADDYLKSIKSLQAPKSDAEKYLEQLKQQADKLHANSMEEQALAEIQSGRLGAVTAKMREQILLAARKVDAEKKADEDAKEMDRVHAMNREQLKREEAADAALTKRLADERQRTIDTAIGRTITGRIKELRAQYLLLAEELQQTTDPERWKALQEAIQATAKELEDTARSADKTQQAIYDMAQQGARDIEGAFGETLQRVARGQFSGILDMWIDLLLRMAVQAQAAQLGKALFGEGGSGLTGGIASIFAALLGKPSGTPATSGNSIGTAPLPAGYTGGAATGTNELQRDMIMLVHKGESITPAAYNPAKGRAGVHIHNYAGAQVEAKERDDGGVDIEILTRAVEQRMAGNVGAGRGPMSAALKSAGLNRSGSLARIG